MVNGLETKRIGNGPEIQPVIDKLKGVWLPRDLDNGRMWETRGMTLGVVTPSSRTYSRHGGVETLRIRVVENKQQSFNPLKKPEIRRTYMIDRDTQYTVQRPQEYPFLIGTLSDKLKKYIVSKKSYQMSDINNISIHLNEQCTPDNISFDRYIRIGSQESYGARVDIGVYRGAAYIQADYGMGKNEYIQYSVSKDSPEPSLSLCLQDFSTFRVATYKMDASGLYRAQIGQGLTDRQVGLWEGYLQKTVAQVLGQKFDVFQPFGALVSSFEQLARQKICY